LFAGCGDSDDDAPSKSEFLAKGNAICAKGNKDIDAAAEKAFGESQPTKQEIEDFATQSAIPSVESQVSQLRDLKPPKDDEDQVDAILAAAEADIEKVKADPSLFEGDTDPFADANKLAEDYGLTECGGDPEA